MWRFSLLLPTVFAWMAFAGCGGPAQPKPLSADQERQLQKQMEETQQQEQSHFSQEDTGNTKGRR